MFPSNHLDELVVAHTRSRRLHAEAAAERLHRVSPTRRAVSAWLRRAADRLDPTAFAGTPGLRADAP